MKKYKQSNYISWCADNQDGTYTNPILYVDYSDPDVVRVGEDYFMVASSFCNAPGLPLLHSRDLVNWKLINYCIDSIPGQQYDRPLHGCGVWAPAIRYYNGEFIVFFPMPDEGIYVVKTKDPWGKWDEPYCLYAAKGWIDPCPFWDEDGKAYMVNGFAKSRIGFKSILQIVEMTPDCTKLIGEPKYVFDGNCEDEETIEGPKLYKKDGYYYIFAPAGGVKQGWQTVLRSENIWGPYEKRRVCMQMDTKTNGPHQGAWVDTVTGEDWFIHFQDVYAAGRIVHLEPMSWKDNWPLIGEGKPVDTYNKPNVGEVSEAEYEAGLEEILKWQWNANYKKDFGDISNDRIILNCIPKKDNTLSDMPNLLLQKWELPEFTVKTKLRLDTMQTGDITGLVSFGTEYGAIAVKKTEQEYKILNIHGIQRFENERAKAEEVTEIIGSFALDTTDFYFAYQVEQVESIEKNTDGPFEFDVPREMISLYYSKDNTTFVKTNSFVAKAGRWVGVKHGLFAFNDNGDCEKQGKANYSYYKFVPKIAE